MIHTLDTLLENALRAKAHTEAELDRRQEEISSILEASSMIMGMVEIGDEGMRIMYLNKAGIKHYGQGEEVFGKLATEIGMPENITNEWSKNYRACKESGKPLVFDYTSFKHARYFSTTVNYIGLSRDGVEKYCFVTEDTTERKLAEEQRSRNMDAMALLSKMSSLGEMASGIAHETHNPLSIINGFADLLIKRVNEEGIDPQKLVSIALEIKKTCTRITSVMDGLRYFAGGGPNELPERISVKSIIESTVNITREKFRTHGVNLELINLDSEAFVQCRQTQISQVLLNLLNNAFDAVQNTSEKNISIRVSESDAFWNLDIEDSGHGISQDHKTKIFQPFFTTKPVGKGSGLGLSICKGIIEAHQGRIHLISSPGSSAIFRIQLPVSPF